MPTATATDVRRANPTALATTTDPQHVASVIRITFDPETNRLSAHPDTVEAYYAHHGGGGNEMKPHRLLWMAMFKRDPGVRIVIRLNQVHHPPRFPLSKPEVEASFPGNPSYCPPRTWVIESDENAVETLPVALPTDWYGRIDFKYDISLMRFAPDLDLHKVRKAGRDPFDEGRVIAHLDPGGNIIPDP